MKPFMLLGLGMGLTTRAFTHMTLKYRVNAGCLSQTAARHTALLLSLQTLINLTVPLPL